MDKCSNPECNKNLTPNRTYSNATLQGVGRICDNCYILKTSEKNPGYNKAAFLNEFVKVYKIKTVTTTGPDLDKKLYHELDSNGRKVRESQLISGSGPTAVYGWRPKEWMAGEITGKVVVPVIVIDDSATLTKKNQVSSSMGP